MRLFSIYIVFSIVFSISLEAQFNYVPNYSFEQYDSCPSLQGGIDPNCTYWFSPMSKMNKLPPNPYSVYNWGSSDYYNICNKTNLSIPKNLFGYQYSKEGDAYAGIAYSNQGSLLNDYKEYIEVKLFKNLSHNKVYCVEFYYSICDNFNESEYYPIEIGALLTDTLISRLSGVGTQQPQNIYAKPQVKQQLPLIRDTLNWIKVSGSFFAQGGEQYLTIGNFQHTDTITNKSIYVYIDDVKLWLCDSGDTTSPILPRELKVYPIPSLNNKITVEYVNASLGGMQFCLYNCLGQIVYKYRFASGVSKQELSLIHLSSGVYFYSLGSNDAVYEKGKIILL